MTTRFVRFSAMGRRSAGLLRRLVADRSGAGAIEFAILLPVLVILYFGAVELGDGFAAKRKVTSTTSALGDLVTRAKDISLAEMDEILTGAPRVVLYPYPVTDKNIEIKVTCAAIDADRIATVKWSEAVNETKDRAGQRLSAPAGVSLPNSKIVLVSVVYKYEPKLGAYIDDQVDLTSSFYFKPREAGTVCYDGTCC